MHVAHRLEPLLLRSQATILHFDLKVVRTLAVRRSVILLSYH
jgi:hypothetical protein